MQGTRNEQYNVAQVDDEIMQEIPDVDWHSVSEGEMMRFGLALGLYRDMLNVYRTRLACWQTAAGSVSSITVLSVVIMLLGLGAKSAIICVIITQTLRMLWLFWKLEHCRNDVGQFHSEAVEQARLLAATHSHEKPPVQ